MKIEENKIIFKSLPEFWEKEYLNKKPYTVRFLDREEYYLLQKAIKKYGESGLLIDIKNIKSGDSFIRRIIDISLFGEFLNRYFIGIAWETEKNK